MNILWRRRQPCLPSIEVLRLEPGDTVLVTADNELTQEQAEHVQAKFAAKLPGHEVLVVSTALRVSVVRAYVPEKPDPTQAST